MAKKQKTQKVGKTTCMKFRDLRKILEDNGYEITRRTNTTHAKFENKEIGHSVIVSGFEGGRGRQGTVEFPIVHKTLKALREKGFEV